MLDLALGNIGLELSPRQGVVLPLVSCSAELQGGTQCGATPVQYNYPVDWAH